MKQTEHSRQKAYPGENTDRHGIRLDVCLARGMEYSALRNVVVIFITTYDPFGLNRMVYTISNKCEEVPEMPYDDGAKTLFLYTKGTEGNPPEELRQLLHYMEDTRVENAVTSELRELHDNKILY